MWPCPRGGGHGHAPHTRVNLTLPIYLLRRLAMLVPQLLAVSFVAFVLIRLLPGNPAELILGPQRTDESVAQLEQEMGLDKPIPEQYWLYLKDIANGDLGRSFFTGSDVKTDLVDRFPATLELLGYAMLVALIVGTSMGAIAAMMGNRGWFVGATNIYSRLAGALPDFWIALIAIYVFYYVLGIFPAPLGRLDADIVEPDQITGFLTVDSLLQGNLAAFSSAAAHLALPVLVLGLVVAPMIGRITNRAMTDILRADHIRFAHACGLRRRTVYRYALRNALPPVLTVLGVLFVFLLGGAVLIEKVFSWGGIGQYATNAVINDDYAPLQGFVLVAAAFTMIVYLVVDVLHMALDPRVKL